jgi:hypothetical protein
MHTGNVWHPVPTTSGLFQASYIRGAFRSAFRESGRRENVSDVAGGIEGTKPARGRGRYAPRRCSSKASARTPSHRRRHRGIVHNNNFNLLVSYY